MRACARVLDITPAELTERLRARVRAACPCVLLLFYFRPRFGGPSIAAIIPDKRFILPMKIVNGV